MTNVAAQNTLLLDLTTWDLCVDSAGNIAMATPPYSTAQDVASALRVFLGECWYDTTQGIPYFGAQPILGGTPPVGVFEALMVQAALTVPGVVSAQCVVNAFVNRKVTGQVTFTDNLGNAQTVTVGGSANAGGSWTADSTVVTADSTVYTA